MKFQIVFKDFDGIRKKLSNAGIPSFNGFGRINKVVSFAGGGVFGKNYIDFLLKCAKTPLGRKDRSHYGVALNKYILRGIHEGIFVFSKLAVESCMI